MNRARSFRISDEAVSPVISTILMVAITVVLAATAFVLVADVGGNSSKSTPAVGFRVDESADRLIVTTAASGADWNRLVVKKVSDQGTGSLFIGASAAGGYQNEAAAVTGANLATDVEVTTTNALMRATDFLEICRSAGGTDGAVSLDVLDAVANAVMGRYTFLTVDAAGC